MAKKLIHRPFRQEAVRRRGNPGFLVDMLEWLGPDTVKWEDDFMGDLFKGGAAPGVYQSSTDGVGGTAAAIQTGAVGGKIDFAAGATDDGYSTLSLGLHFRGDHYSVLAACIEIDTITTVKVEVGFTDVLSGTDAGAVNLLATPTFRATDFLGWVIDTDDTAYWQAVGVKAGTAATKIEDSIAPVAATQEWLVVALIDDVGYFYRAAANGSFTYASAPMAAACTKTVLLTPWIFVQSRSAAAHTASLDYLGVWQRRTT